MDYKNSEHNIIIDRSKGYLSATAIIHQELLYPQPNGLDESEIRRDLISQLSEELPDDVPGVFTFHRQNIESDCAIRFTLTWHHVKCESSDVNIRIPIYSQKNPIVE